MTLQELQQYLLDRTGKLISTTSIISRWTNKYHLLGNIPIEKGKKKRRDYETVKERALIVTILHRHLGKNLRWIKDLFDMPIEKSERILLGLIDSTEATIIPMFKRLILGRWKEIAKA